MPQTPPTPAQTYPEQGDRIRVELGPDLVRSSNLPSLWEGTFMTFQGESLVVRGGSPPRAMRVPFDGIRSLAVERERSAAYAVAKGGLFGAAAGVGAWQFLKILCRSGCDDGLSSAWLPGVVTGGLIALIVATKTPGRHWVGASLPR